jgi:hypothetical protein
MEDAGFEAMASNLVASLVVTAAAIPYVVEVLLQLPLLTRVMRALPDDVRARLPRHPRRPALAVFGSARFFLALFRLALRKDPADGPELSALKRKMRASAVREAAFGVVFWVTAGVLWGNGWRPFS